MYDDSSTPLSWHLPYLGEGESCSIFPPFDLQMKLSYIPLLKIITGHVIKHSRIIETNTSKLKQQSFWFGRKSVRHLK